MSKYLVNDINRNIFLAFDLGGGIIIWKWGQNFSQYTIRGLIKLRPENNGNGQKGLDLNMWVLKNKTPLLLNTYKEY